MDTQKTKSAQGQVVVEYVLLLVVSVFIVALISNLTVSRNPGSPGFLIKKWHDIIQFIGEDYPDDL